MALHVLAGALVAKVQAVPKLAAKVSMSRVVSDFEARLDARGLVGPLYLLGDSHTQHIGPIANAVNLGVSGSTTAGMIATAQRLHKAGGVALMIGTNDVWRHKIAGLDDRLALIAKLLPLDVPVVWSAIPPADDVRIDPADIERANVTVRKLCAAHPRCTFIDTGAILASEGQPDPRYFTPDGVHLSAAGYERWLGSVMDSLEYRP